MNALGLNAGAPAWQPGNYVTLGNGVNVTWDGNQFVNAPAVPTTGVTAGAPGSFTGGTPADLNALNALNLGAGTPAWQPGTYVTLGNGANVMWDGNQFVNVPTATATGVTAGKPGTFTGGTVPQTLGELRLMGINGGAAWTSGEFVRTNSGTDAYWNGTIWIVGVAPNPVVPAPITAVLAGDGTSTLTLTVNGGPADQAYTVTISGLSVGGSAIAGISPVPVAQGDTPSHVANLIETEIAGKQDAGGTVTIAVAKAGKVLTITETGGGTFDAGATVGGVLMDLLWLTRGPQAGQFLQFPPEQATAIVAAGLGQRLEGERVEALHSAQITAEVYPTSGGDLLEDPRGPEPEPEPEDEPEDEPENEPEPEPEDDPEELEAAAKKPKPSYTGRQVTAEKPKKDFGKRTYGAGSRYRRTDSRAEE